MERLPGHVPGFLVDDSVGLLRAEDRVFEAMLDGWRAQMLARGLTSTTIKGRCGVVARFRRFTDTCHGEAPRSGFTDLGASCVGYCRGVRKVRVDPVPTMRSVSASLKTLP